MCALPNIARSNHWTDTRLAGRSRRRSIGNWSNYRTSAGLWLQTNHIVEDTQSTPDDWEGPDFHFTKHISRGPLQLYFGDTTDPDNTTMIGARLSQSPGKWLQVQAQGVTPGVSMQVVAAENQVRWVNLWPKSTLVYQATSSGFRKYIHLREGHPSQFKLAVRVPAGGSILPDGNGAKVLDDQGQEYLKIPAPWGMDSSQGDPQNRRGQPIRVELGWGTSLTEPDGNHVQVFWFTPNQDDLVTAIYPILLDPTTQITGVGAIEDTFLYSAAAASNYGGLTSLFCALFNGGAIGHSVLRLDETQIPAGTITAFRFYFWRFSHFNSQAANNADCFIIKDANTWGEGTATWNTINGAGAWDGQLGCSLEGTDYDTDASPPTLSYLAYTAGAAVPHVIALVNAWAAAWREGSRTNQGFVFRERNATVSSLLSVGSTENGTDPLYFEVDYDVSTKGPRRHVMFE